MGEHACVCVGGGGIETWGTLCGGDKGVIYEKAAGFLKDESRDDEMKGQER